MNQQQQYNPNLNTPGQQQGNYVMNQTIDTQHNNSNNNNNVQNMNIYNPHNQTTSTTINTSKTLKINQMDWAMVIMSSALLGSSFFGFSVLLFSPFYFNFQIVLRTFLVPIGIATLSWIYILFQNREGMGKLLLLGIFILSYSFGIWNIIEIANVDIGSTTDGYVLFVYTFTLIFMGSFLNLLPGTYALIRILQIQFNNTKDKLKDYDIFTFFSTVFVAILWAMGLQVMYNYGLILKFNGPTSVVILAIYAIFHFILLCPIGLNGCIKHNKVNMLICAISSLFLWTYFFICFMVIIDQALYVGAIVFITLGGVFCSVMVLVNALRPAPKHLQQDQALLPN